MAKKFKMLQGNIIAWISLMETSQNGTGTGTGIPKTTICENMYDMTESYSWSWSWSRSSWKWSILLSRLLCYSSSRSIWWSSSSENKSLPPVHELSFWGQQQDQQQVLGRCLGLSRWCRSSLVRPAKRFFIVSKFVTTLTIKVMWVFWLFFHASDCPFDGDVHICALQNVFLYFQNL